MQARIKGAQDAAAQFASSQGVKPAAPAVDTTALGDSSYYGGVGIPGSSLASQGAAATALENAQSGIPVLQGHTDLRMLQQATTKQLLDLAAQRPELHDKITQVLLENERAKLSARLQQQAQDLYASQFGEKVRHDVATETAARHRNQISYQRMVNSHQEAIQKATAAGNNPNASLSKAYGYIVDAKGNPILDKNGNKIPVAKSSSPKSQKQKSNAQYQKAVGEAATMFKDSQPTAPAAPGLPPGPPAREWKWGAALRYLQNRYGISRARARQALITAGFKPPKKPQKPGYIPGTKNRGPGGAGPR